MSNPDVIVTHTPSNCTGCGSDLSNVGGATTEHRLANRVGTILGFDVEFCACCSERGIPLSNCIDCAGLWIQRE